MNKPNDKPGDDTTLPTLDPKILKELNLPADTKVVEAHTLRLDATREEMTSILLKDGKFVRAEECPTKGTVMAVGVSQAVAELMKDEEVKRFTFSEPADVAYLVRLSRMDAAALEAEIATQAELDSYYRRASAEELNTCWPSSEKEKGAKAPTRKALAEVVLRKRREEAK